MFSLLIVTLLTSTLAQFQIDLTLPSFPVKVNPHFASLSLGFDAVAHLFVLYGTNITSMNTIPRVDDILNPKSIALIQTLIKATKDTSGTPLIIKVGGRTADSLYYTTSSKPDWNPNFSLSISPATFYVMRRVSELTGVKWIVNLGMREPSPLLSYNPEIIADVQNIITPLFLYAIQFGNEPDLYFSEGYRPETYSLTDYFNELQAYVDWIKPILPSVKLIGPSFGFRWGSNNLTSFAKASVGSAVSELTVSRFETTDCNILGSPPPPETLATYPSPKTLLFAGQVLTAATNAQKSQTAVFGDYGSATCGRTQGSPSEPFGSALFLLDSLFEMSSKGFGYMNIQASGHSEQSPIYVDTSKYYPITVQV